MIKSRTKLLKPNPLLEEFLFENPDIAISFNELPISDKNKWIKSLWDAKKPEPQVKILLELKNSLQEASDEV